MHKKSYLFIFIILIIILAVIGFAPFISGYLFKRDFINLITAINQQRKDIRLEIVDYRLGWLHSTGTLKLYATKTGFPQEINIDEYISHGPIIYDSLRKKYVLAYAGVLSRVNLPFELKYFLLDKNTQSGIETYSIIDFSGNWTYQTNIPAFSIPEIGILTIEPITGKIKFTLQDHLIKEIDSKTHLGKITFENSIHELRLITIQPATYHYRTIRNTNNLWNANATIDLPLILIKWVSGDQVVIQRIKGIENTDFSSDKASGNAQLSIDRISFSSGALIPEIAKLQVAIAAKDFNTKAIQDFYAFIKTHDVAALGEEQQAMTVENKLMNLLTPTSQVNLDVSLQSTLGPLTFQNKFLWQGELPYKTLEEVLANTKAEINLRVAIPLANKLVAGSLMGEEKWQGQQINQANQTSGVHSVPIPIPGAQSLPQTQTVETPVERAEHLLNTWVQEGLLIKEQNDYVTAIVIVNRSITINGKDIKEFQTNKQNNIQQQPMIPLKPLNVRP